MSNKRTPLKERVNKIISFKNVVFKKTELTPKEREMIIQISAKVGQRGIEVGFASGMAKTMHKIKDTLSKKDYGLTADEIKYFAYKPIKYALKEFKRRGTTGVDTDSRYSADAMINQAKIKGHLKNIKLAPKNKQEIMEEAKMVQYFKAVTMTDLKKLIKDMQKIHTADDLTAEKRESYKKKLMKRYRKMYA